MFVSHTHTHTHTHTYVQIARTATCVCSVLVSVWVGGAPREENPSIWDGRGKVHEGGDDLLKCKGC